MEDDNRVTAHPVLMLTIHEGILWCLPLRWPKIFQVLVWTLHEHVKKVLSHNNSILLPKPHRADFYMEVKKGQIRVAVFVLSFSVKLKETNTPKVTAWLTGFIKTHHWCITISCHGSTVGNQQTVSFLTLTRMRFNCITKRQPHALLSWTRPCLGPY